MTEPGGNEPQPPYGQQPPSGEQPPQPYEPPTYEAPQAPQPPQAPQAPPPPGYASYGAQPAPGAPYGQPGPYGAPMGQPGAPYGVHPVTGVPYSDKQKLVAGLLQIFLGGFGIGRFYIGDTQTGVLQIVVTILTCGIGSLWGLIDGILMLTGEPTDSQGRPLRPN